MKKLLYVPLMAIVCLLLTSCENDFGPNIYEPELTFVDIYLEDDKDSNGYYHVQSNGNAYHSVYCFSEPYKRIFWGTNNYFYVEDWLDNTYEEPIIQHSIYTDNYGEGQQIFSLSGASVGDTLMIYGYINETAWDYLYLIIAE